MLFFEEIQPDESVLIVCRDCGNKAPAPDAIEHGFGCINKPLPQDLKLWRAERPDEWTMDRFIQKAERLETELAEYKKYDSAIKIIKSMEILQPRVAKNERVK